MKNLLSISLLLIAFLIPSLVAGQSNLKGTVFLGAELLGNSNDRVLDFNMTPRVGYFISDKFVLGASMDRQIFSFRGLRFSDLGLFGRYYLPFDGSAKENFLNRLTFFGEATLKPSFRTIENGNVQVDLGVNTFLGTNVKLNDKLFLEVSLSPDLNDGLNLEPRVGLEYRLGSKKNKE